MRALDKILMVLTSVSMLTVVMLYVEGVFG